MNFYGILKANILYNVAADSGRIYAVMQNCRYNKMIRSFREIVQSGAIGQPGFVCVDLVVPSVEHKFTRELEKIEPAMQWKGREAHDGCQDEMFLAHAEGGKAETDCTDNIKSMSMVFGALEGAGKQKKIFL